MLFEPFAVDAVIGADALHKRPECFRVIHVGQMAELMDDHIVKNGGRRQHQPPVKGEGPFCAAAPPAGLLVADGDAVIASACEGEKVGGAFGEIFFCRRDIAFFEGFALCVRQVGDGAALGPFDCFQIVRDDPVLLIEQKAADLCFGSAKRQPQGDLSLRGDTDCAGFSAAVDHLAGEFIKFALVFDAVYAFHKSYDSADNNEKQAA